MRTERVLTQKIHFVQCTPCGRLAGAVKVGVFHQPPPTWVALAPPCCPTEAFLFACPQGRCRRDLARAILAEHDTMELSVIQIHRVLPDELVATLTAWRVA